MSKVYNFGPTPPKPLSQIRREWEQNGAAMDNLRESLLPHFARLTERDDLSDQERHLMDLFLGAASTVLNYHDEMGMLFAWLPEHTEAP